MSRYFRRDGTPYEGPEPHLQWARDFEAAPVEQRRLAYTVLSGDIEVSTVWLGLDHSFGGGPPLIFETMVFRNGEGCEMERYSTEADALVGHARMVVERCQAEGGAE